MLGIVKEYLWGCQGEIRLNHKADDFASFFQEKVDKIRASTNTAFSPIISEVALNELQTFTETSADEVRRLILNAPNKQCSLDPIPTWLLTECISDIVPFLVDLFNRTLPSTGEIPRALKKAIITPILKKPNLDKDDISNYRPVSNLPPFISKTLEKVVVLRFTKYLESNRLMSRGQSAYQRFHSTETALLRLLSDLTSAVESGRKALLALLDMSAAFHTVAHSILLH